MFSFGSDGEEMNTIDVVLVTWPNHPKRLEYLRHTWATLQKNLRASDHTLRFLCSSESERDQTRPWLGEELKNFCRANCIPLTWHDGPASLGAGMNAALRVTTANLIFLVQDDYELVAPLDLSPGATLLTEHHDVDLVRYSFPVNLGCRFDGEINGWRKFDLAAPWPYGDEPALRRRDFMDRHGWYTEGIGQAAEGDMLFRLMANKAVIVAADKPYFGNFGAVSAVPLDCETRNREVSR